MAGITIQKGRTTRNGDGGVFLSIVITTVLTGFLWAIMGNKNPSALTGSNRWNAIFIFALAGVFATVLGRLFMYRSTELIGPIGASMLRRLIPIFAVPLSIALIREWPDHSDLIGGGLLLSGVYVFSAKQTASWSGVGITLGLLSALSYALSYTLRKSSLEVLPDPILGTFIGALAGMICYGVWILISGDPLGKLKFLMVDTRPWFLLTAVLLSLGQTLQLIALQISSVAVVAFVGSMDVLFTAIFASIILRERLFQNARFTFAMAFVLMGVGYLSLG